MKNIHILLRNLRKIMADFLGVEKIFIQGQECGFAAK